MRPVEEGTFSHYIQNKKLLFHSSKVRAAEETLNLIIMTSDFRQRLRSSYRSFDLIKYLKIKGENQVTRRGGIGFLCCKMKSLYKDLLQLLVCWIVIYVFYEWLSSWAFQILK